MLNKKKSSGFALLIIFILAALVRIIWIEADPPRVIADISGSAGIYFDEGIYAHNARNKILFKSWVRDDFNPLIYNPLLTLIYYVVLKIFGVNVLVVKGVSILFGLFSIFFFWKIVRLLLAEHEAILLTVIFSFDFINISYNRLGLIENFNLCCFLLTFFLLIRFLRTEKSIIALVFWATVGLLSKYLYVFFFMALLVIIFLHCWRKKNWKPLIFSGISIIVLLNCWYFLLFKPFSSNFASISGGWGALAIPSNLNLAWKNLRNQPFFKYFAFNPGLILIVIVFFGLQIVEFFKVRLNQLNLEKLFIFFWAGGGLIQLGILNYRPLRYYLPLLPAFYLAIAFMNSFEKSFSRKEFFLIGGVSVFSAVLFQRNLLSTMSKTIEKFAVPSFFILFTFVVLLIALISLIYRKRLIFWTSFGLITLSMFSYIYFRNIVFSHSFNLQFAAGYFEKNLAGATVIGQEAIRLNFNTKNSAFMAYDRWFNAESPIERFSATHLVVLNKFGNAELNWLLRKYPHYKNWLYFVKKFRIWDSTVSLYRISRD